MIGFSSSVEGFAELEKQLLQIEPKVARRSLTSSLRKGGQIVKVAAASNVRKDTTLTEKSLKVKASSKVFSGPLANLEAFVEGFGGISSRFILGDDKVGVITVKVGAYKPSPVKGRHKNYPGDPYYARFLEARFPFLRPALDQNAERIIVTVKNALAAALERLNSRK